MIQRGTGTGRAFFPPRSCEPGTGDLPEWFAPSGRATVYSITVVRRRDPEPDYNVALVDLDEGPRLMTRIEGIAPDQVRIGMRVAARVVIEDDAPLLVFEAAP